MADDVTFTGKKIFFLNPTYTITTEIIPALFNMEYETYSIENYRDAKAILKKNPDSICLMNIDSQMTLPAWFMFIDSFKGDEDLKRVCVGCFSDKIIDEEKQLFLDRLQPACGIINTTGKKDVLIKSVVDVINMNGARGKRQFIRVMCLQDKSAELVAQWGSSMCRMKMLDISSVGTAVQIPAQYRLMFQEKTLIPNVTLRLGTATYTVSIAVFQIFERGGATMAVTMFGKNTSSNVTTAVKNYIFSALQHQMFISINGIGPDPTDYATLGQSFEKQLAAEKDFARKEKEKKASS